MCSIPQGLVITNIWTCWLLASAGAPPLCGLGWASIPSSWSVGRNYENVFWMCVILESVDRGKTHHPSCCGGPQASHLALTARTEVSWVTENSAPRQPQTLAASTVCPLPGSLGPDSHHHHTQFLKSLNVYKTYWFWFAAEPCLNITFQSSFSRAGVFTLKDAEAFLWYSGITEHINLQSLPALEKQ